MRKTVESELKKKLRALSHIRNELDIYKKKTAMLDRFESSPSFFSFFFCLKERKNRKSELRRIMRIAGDNCFREIRADFFKIIKDNFDRVDAFYKDHRREYRAGE